MSTSIDVPTLHRLLRRRADRMGRLRLVQAELAEELGMSKFHLNRILRRMEEAGQIRKIATAKRFIHTYVISEPEE